MRISHLGKFRRGILLIGAVVAWCLAMPSGAQPVAQQPANAGGALTWSPPPFAPQATDSALPPAVITDPAIRLAEAPSLPADDPLGIAAQQQAQSFPPPGVRQGIFQRANATGTYLPRFEDDSLGISRLSLDATFGVPFPTRDAPLLITPAYRVLFLDGPDFIDVPPRVHEAEIGLQHFRPINDRWLFNGAITFGVYADDDSFDSSESFRVTGRALGIYELSKQWKGIVGVVYLNRAGLSVVPAAGLTYDRGDLKVDLIFPQPRIAWLLPGSTPQAGDQRWFYVMGELGGNIWAVQRTTGADDALSYRDIRILLGYERKIAGGVSQRWEFGYVFDRSIEFESDDIERALDDTLVLRTTWTY